LQSIHDSYSRFVTVHGTHEAIVKDVVGYNCHGHGFFLEDGYETENKERFLFVKLKKLPSMILYEVSTVEVSRKRKTVDWKSWNHG